MPKSIPSTGTREAAFRELWGEGAYYGIAEEGAYHGIIDSFNVYPGNNFACTF